MNITYQVQITGIPTKEIRRIIAGIAFGIEAEMKLAMTGPKSGREYPRGGGKIHLASAPGEAPAVDTSFLINSIQAEMKSDTEGVIVIGAEYAEILEFEKDRPFVRPAIESVTKRFDSGGFLGGANE